MSDAGWSAKRRKRDADKRNVMISSNRKFNIMVGSSELDVPVRIGERRFSYKIEPVTIKTFLGNCCFMVGQVYLRNIDVVGQNIMQYLSRCDAEREQHQQRPSAQRSYDIEFRQF